MDDAVSLQGSQDRNIINLRKRTFHSWPFVSNDKVVEQVNENTVVGFKNSKLAGSSLTCISL